jgi:beta-glucosidase
VLPTGTGPVEPRGLDFYDRLVDGLLERGLAPYLTLFHWDLPQALEDKGGWTARDTAERFAEYASTVAARLGDRVAAWITLNEPAVTSFYGYALGTSAPGRTLSLAVYPVVHHLLLGHGLAVRALRASGVAGKVGITNNLAPIWPEDPRSAADVAAAERYAGLRNWQFVDPILLRRQPFDVEQVYLGSDFSAVRSGDADAIAEPVDFLGVNYYAPELVRAPSEGNPLGFEEARIEGVPRSGFDWPVVPDGLTELLTGLRPRYGDALPPLYVTENGTSVEDTVEEGHVHDRFRIAFIDRHLRAVAAAMAAGADVRGYFYWSLMDNFEWEEGFGQRFGLVYTDFQTQARIPKDSFDFYRSVVARRRAPAP